MYEKITLCLLLSLMIGYSEEVPTVKNVETADFSDLRLSTVLPYPSLYNDEHPIKENSKRSLVLLMPLSQTRNKHEKSKDTVQKTKRCGAHRKNRFLLSTKGDSNKIRSTDKYVGIPKQNSNDHVKKFVKYPQEKSTASKRMIAETDEDEILLRALKNDLNAEDVIINLKSQEKTKKCKTGKYICHCKEENCFPSLEDSSSEMLDFSRIDNFERTNQRRPTKYENAKPDILQQKSSIYHESLDKLPPSNLINHFAIQPYQERIPPVPVLYGIIPNIAPYMFENDRKHINVGIPITSFESKPDYVGNNQYQPTIRQKPCICSPITERDQVESSMSVTSPSTNYADATIKETTNDLESNSLIGQTDENQEHVKLTTEAPNTDSTVDSETKTNLYLNNSTDVTEESTSSFNLNKVTPELEDFTEQTERNPDNSFSELTTYPTNYVDISSIPPFIYGTNDGKLINMEECIQLFGRDVCVLSATSQKMLAKQAQENNPNKYFTIRIPEYVTQISAARKGTALNNNYSDKLKISDPYFASKFSTNGIDQLNNNLNKYLKSTKSNADVDKGEYPESIKQISEPNMNYDKNKSFNIIKNTHIPMKKLMDPTVDETAEMEKNKLLGKSKSHVTKLLLNPNYKEIENSTSSEKFFYSIPSYKSKNKETNSLKINPQNRVININSNLNTFSKEETSYDSKTGKETIGLESVHPEGISQEQSTTMQYFDNKKSSNLNHKIDTTNNFKAPDSSTSKLPFYDNILLLNSIKKVINDFVLDPRLTKTKDFDKNTLQSQDKNFLPEILQVPNLKDILSTPQIENTIVEKVKDVLSNVTAIPRRDFTNDYSHSVIKNTLHSILDTLSDFHHKLPPMTLEEHQFKDGQWGTNLVTLTPISNQKFSKGTPENLRESIKDLLSSSAIASQTDQHIVWNMIIQSLKNSLNNDEDDKIDDSIIHALNDVLQNSEATNALGKSNKDINDKGDINMTFSQQETPISNYKIGKNVDNSTLSNKQNLDIKKDKINNKEMHVTNKQKPKILENNTNVFTTTEFPYLLQLSEKKGETTTKAIDKIKENITDIKQIKKINMQDNAGKKLVEPLKPKIIYHKVIFQNNTNVLTIPEPDSTGTEQYIKNHRIDEESVKDTTTITNFMQETSPNYAQVSNNIISENMAKIKDNGEEMKHTLNEKTLTTSTEIDPLIILERIEFNLPPTKYYSPEILKYATNRIGDKNITITTESTNLIQETSSNRAQSDDMILQDIAETKGKENEIKYPLATTPGKNILESQQNSRQNLTEDNIIKIHEVTTEVQRTYAKTTYFKGGPSNNDNPRIGSPSLICETTCIRVNNDDEKDNSNNNQIGNKMNNIDNDIREKETIISSSKSSARGNINPQLFSSSITPDDISELQRSQLYYISDGVKLPLEIKKLDDGSYALLISKNVCEKILTRKCPCCVPLQGYVVRSLKNQQEDMITSTINEKKDQGNSQVNNIKSHDQSIQPFDTLIMRRSALRTQKSKEEEKINTHYSWKQNDDNLTIISMPVIDFAKKYNLLLDLNKENYKELLIKSEKVSEYDQSQEENLNNYADSRLDKNNINDQFQDLINIREKKNIPHINFPIFPITQKLFDLRKNSGEFEVQNVNAKMNQSEINQKSKLHKTKTASDEDQDRNLTLKGINTSENPKISKEEIKWDKLDITKGNTKVFRNKENTELIDKEYNIPKIRNLKENIEKPYRYQRNTNGIANKRTELVKSMLYWLKGLFVDN